MTDQINAMPLIETLSCKEKMLILTPVIAGLLFVMLVFVNHQLFLERVISARQAAGAELFIVVIVVVAGVRQCFVAIKRLRQKRRRPALLCLLSCLLFCLLLVLGQSLGAAIFYAT